MALSEFCERLAALVPAAESAVRDFVVAHPAVRQDVAGVPRELGEIRMTCELLRSQDDAEGGDATPNVRSAAVAVGHLAAGLVDEVVRIVKQRPRENWVQDAVSSLSEWVRWAETVRLALNLGLDALILSKSQPAALETDLPPYQSTQIIQVVADLRARIAGLSESDQFHEPTQVSAIMEMLDSVQQYVEQTSTSLLVPSPSVGGRAPSVISAQSEVASVRSDMPPPRPPRPPPEAMEPVAISYPAPESINLQQVSKTDMRSAEIVRIAINRLRGRHVVSVLSPGSVVKMLDMRGVPLPGVKSDYCVDMAFCENTLVWAYVADMDTSVLSSDTRFSDYVQLKRPVTCVANWETGQKLLTLQGTYARTLAFSHDGSRHVLAKPGGRMFLVHGGPAGSGLGPGGHSKRVVNCLHTDDVTHGVFTPDGRTFVSVSRDGTIRLTDPDTGASLGKLDVGTWKRPEMLGVTPDGRVVVSIWGDTVYRWEHATGGLDTYVLGERLRRESRPLAASSDCRFLACGNHEGVDLMDLHTGRVLKAIRFLEGYVTAAAFSQDGRYLALGKAMGGIVRPAKATLDIWELVF